MKFCIQGVVILFFLLFGEFANADATKALTMPEIAKNADVVFFGVCNSIESIKIKNLSLGGIKITFSVEEVVKGSVSNPYSFSQIITKGDPPYKIGQRYWLFLGAPSPIDPNLNLRSPLGLDQGMFRRIEDEKSGKAMVVNGRSNIGLFRGAETSPSISKAMSAGDIRKGAGGPMDAEVFSNMVKALVNE